MSKQPALNHIFEKAMKKLEEKVKSVKARNSIVNTSTPLRDDSWTAKIVAKIRISDMATDFGIDCCPDCGYGVTFDDSRGSFICNRRKYDMKCEFKGNILDFEERFG